MQSPPTPFALGIDAGGTQTRWALADAGGTLVAEGQAPAFSALQLAAEPARIEAALNAIVPGHAVAALAAGITGYDDAQREPMSALLARAFALPAAAVRAFGDVALLAHAAFAPGEGIVVYAGTGSIAVHIDAGGHEHRAGGRGVLIDDAGGGHWVAREALRAVWRAEDERPGGWRGSTLATEVFAQIGGSDWAATRSWAYGASRGEFGLLALAVARAAAAGDAQAIALLRAAGRELARLAAALQARVGALPVALAGRAWLLHAEVEAGFRDALSSTSPGATARRFDTPPHHAAATLAASTIPRCD